MSKYIPGNRKHLTLDDRRYIERALNQGSSFQDIARFLCKDPTTISKEVRNHRLSDWYHKGTFYNVHNFCVHRYHCRKTNVCGKIILCNIKCISCPTTIYLWLIPLTASKELSIYYKKKEDSSFFEDFFKVIYNNPDKNGVLWIKLRKLKFSHFSLFNSN